MLELCISGNEYGGSCKGPECKTKRVQKERETWLT